MLGFGVPFLQECSPLPPAGDHPSRDGNHRQSVWHRLSGHHGQNCPPKFKALGISINNNVMHTLHEINEYF